MISRGPLAYNAEETCRLLSMIILDAGSGRFGVQIARVVKNVGEKETPLGEKETTWRKSDEIGEKLLSKKKYMLF